MNNASFSVFLKITGKGRQTIWKAENKSELSLNHSKKWLLWIKRIWRSRYQAERFLGKRRSRRCWRRKENWAEVFSYVTPQKHKSLKRCEVDRGLKGEGGGCFESRKWRSNQYISFRQFKNKINNPTPFLFWPFSPTFCVSYARLCSQRNISPNPIPPTTCQTFQLSNCRRITNCKWISHLNIHLPNLLFNKDRNSILFFSPMYVIELTFL